MKVIKVDGNVYLAEVGEGKIEQAMTLSRSTLGTEVHKTNFAEYLQAKNLGELMVMEYGSTSAFASRELTVVEKHLLGSLEFSMGQAKDLAVRDLENLYFGKLIGGK